MGSEWRLNVRLAKPNNEHAYIGRLLDSLRPEMFADSEAATTELKTVKHQRLHIAALTEKERETLTKMPIADEDTTQYLEAKVAERTAQLQKANEHLEKLTLTDEATGLYNQRFLSTRLDEEFHRSQRYSPRLVGDNTGPRPLQTRQ